MSSYNPIIMNMKKIFIAFMTIFLLVVHSSSCEKEEEKTPSGNVTVNLTNAESVNGYYIIAYIYDQNETDINNNKKLLAVNLRQIESGAASIILEEDNDAWYPVGTEWEGMGDKTYDIYIFLISNLTINYPEIGTNPFPMSVSINGNQIINIDYNQMIDFKKRKRFK